jgi:hypothetical protein
MSTLDYAPPTEPQPYDYTAGTKNVRAILTTRWNSSGYTPKIIRNIETCYTDTSLDNDADPWQLEIGDPNGDYLECLSRNNEVRVEIFGVGSGVNSLPTLHGIADEVDYGDDGVLRLTGRDYSALAVDSTVQPGKYRKFQAWRLVDQQAREIGFKRTMLAKTGPNGPIIRKLQVTDGSESYWEFWHRIYRKEQMWIWTEPGATLVANKLNYEKPASYFFGSARRTDSKFIARQFIPVERLEIRSSKQNRLGEVWVYGHKGDNGFLVRTSDPTTAGWIKRPRKIMLDTEAHTKSAAMKTAWEEIFESKVGAVEYSLTIPDPGFPIKQNEIALLNLTDPDIQGEFFVVGVRRQIGPEGFLQEVRLRERQYAISRRIPQDPKLKSSNTPSQGTQDAGFSSGISAVANMPEEWATFFIKAANTYHGPWDYNLFLATLIAICDQETGGTFTNIRANGGPGGDHHPWEIPPSGVSVKGSHNEGGSTALSLDEWKQRYANEGGDGYVTHDFAVGPMQLYSLSYKHFADDLFKPNYRNEFQGGRWVAEHNIMAGAYALRDKLKLAVADSGRDIDMWAGVSYYGHHYAGETPTTVPTRYAVSVKAKVYTEPGYLPQVKDARATAIAQAKTANNDPAGTSATDPGDSRSADGNYHNSPEQLARLTWIRVESNHVDLSHVNYTLLKRLNALGQKTGRIIDITSGFRYTGTPIDGPGAGPNGDDTQWYLYNRYKQNGFALKYIAAKPNSSNHEKGEACDCNVGGVAIANAFSGATLAAFGLNCTVDGDPVHCTRVGVTG